MMIELAIVIISKNQAWNISRLIESVLKETTHVRSKEVILVDSASTDETTKIACSYPIHVLRLKSGQHLTPAAGRYVGYGQTSAEFILFLDGDMELYPGWIDKALLFIGSRPDVASVTGKRVDLLKTAKFEDPPKGSINAALDIIEVHKSGGAALYRRSALIKTGSFNPYLYSDEEPDLCIRIRNMGYKIIQLQYPIVFHRTDPSNELRTKVLRWRRNLYLGAGQNLRYYMGKKIFLQYVKERGFGILPVFGLLAGFACLLWYIISGESIPIRLWLLSLSLLIIVDTCKKRSLYKTIVSLLERLFIADGTIRGFLMKPRPPEEYLARYEQLQ